MGVRAAAGAGWLWQVKGSYGVLNPTVMLGIAPDQSFPRSCSLRAAAGTWGRYSGLANGSAAGAGELRVPSPGDNFAGCSVQQRKG